MGRAAKLKQQRKRQVYQPHFLTFVADYNRLSPFNRRLEQNFPDLMVWLIDQWGNAPQFRLDFTVDEAQSIATKALRLLAAEIQKTPDVNVAIQWQFSKRFQVHLFIDIEKFCVDTLLLDTIDKQIIDFESAFQL